MVVEGLDVCEHTHGVWLVPHVQHVLNLDQTEAVSLLPETETLVVKVSDFTNTVKGIAASIGYFFVVPHSCKKWLNSLLCCGEGQLEVVFAVCSVQRVVIKLQREERVDQSTERHPITPAGREVLDVYVLRDG